MKLLIALCLVALAVAEPEADSQFVYNGYGNYGYPYAYSAYNGAYNYPAYTYGAYPYNYGAYHHLYKRDAEAEPQVFHPYAYNAYPYAYNHAYHPYAYTHPVVTKVEYKAPEVKEVKVAAPVATYAYTHPVAAYHPYTYSAPVAHVAAQVIPRYHAKSAENVEHTVLKRSADSEADPFYFYNTYGAYPYAYSGAYNSAYRYPYAYNGYASYPYAYHY